MSETEIRPFVGLTLEEIEGIIKSNVRPGVSRHKGEGRMNAPAELPELEDIIDKAIKYHSCGMIGGDYLFTTHGVRAVLREALLDLYGEIDLLLEDEDMIASNKQDEVIKELAMLVKRLSSTLKIAVPKSRLAQDAMAYLESSQLLGSITRGKTGN